MLALIGISTSKGTRFPPCVYLKLQAGRLVFEICCTSAARLLHACCTSAAHLCCTSAAPLPHISAELLLMYRTSVAALNSPWPRRGWEAEAALGLRRLAELYLSTRLHACPVASAAAAAALIPGLMLRQLRAHCHSWRRMTTMKASLRHHHHWRRLRPRPVSRERARVMTVKCQHLVRSSRLRSQLSSFQFSSQFSSVRFGLVQSGSVQRPVLFGSHFTSVHNLVL